jgi:hypothetical protein
MPSTILTKVLAIALAWLPTLFWLIFAVTGIILGTGSLFSETPLGGLVFIALGLGGLLGFIGLTVVCWTHRPMTTTLTIFLLCGAASLSIAAGYLVIAGDWNLADPITLLQLTYFVLCPVAFALYKIAGRFRTADAA